MRRRRPVLPMLALLGAVALSARAATSPRSQGSASADSGWVHVATQDFDTGKLVVFWEGARILSPVHISRRGDDVRLNGFGFPTREPEDTAGFDARLAPRFAGEPIIDSLVRAGHSYLEAGNIYGCELPRRLNRLVLELKHRRTEADERTVFDAIPELAHRVGIAPESVTVRGLEISVSMRGGGKLRRSLDSPDEVLKHDPCSRTSEQAEAAGRATVEMVISELRSGRPGVVYLTHGATRATSAADPDIALAQVGQRAARIRQGWC